MKSESAYLYVCEGCGSKYLSETALDEFPTHYSSSCGALVENENHCIRLNRVYIDQKNMFDDNFDSIVKDIREDETIVLLLEIAVKSCLGNYIFDAIFYRVEDILSEKQLSTIVVDKKILKACFGDVFGDEFDTHFDV
jgi:hypothetical protein